MPPDAPTQTPSPRELRWFGLAPLVFFGILGAVLGRLSGSSALTHGLWLFGAVLCVGYYAVRPLRRPFHAGWHAVFRPIGEAVSWLLLAIVYFGVVTPLALLARGLGRDRLAARLEPSAASYWVKESPAADPSRYFRQY